ncbi:MULTISPECIES: response regulator [unclassified Haladaptatus]|uniref:response regulator n=1 Tax=unclassified Haladaptatus TaxID=2622732 RepID=UPI00209BBB48|nr:MULTISPECIES: response regulator [unclassified Haladaptatus]MCO8246272.1 response regulator [Haladaptatus sp. AB643]MCO8255174.1 response regulator [Haladaptatus sp. AB618]
MGEAALILALGKRERNLELLADLLKNGGYDVEIATSMGEFDELLEQRDDVALAVLDVDGFTEDIWKRCEQLNARDIPMLVLAAQIPPAMRQKAVSRGAQTILEKPVDKADLQATIRGLMEYIRMNR